MSDSSASGMMSSLQTTASPGSQQWLSVSPTDSQAMKAAPAQDVVPADSSDLAELSNQQKLATFEAILSELEAEKSSTEPNSFQRDQPTDQPQTPHYSSTLRKEVAPGSGIASVELPGGMLQVESEPDPEIPPELETYLQKIEETQVQIPEEVISAAESAPQVAAAPLPQHVKVLPITKEQLEEGKKQNTSFALRWLVAFSEKMIEMFKGKAVYRTD